MLEPRGGGDARVCSVSTLRVGSDARNGSVHWCDARVGSLKHHLNGFIIKKRILIMNITDLKVSYAERNKSVYARKKEK